MTSENRRLEQFVLQHVADTVHCVSCHRSYDVEELRVLAHRETMWFVKVACEYCGTEGLILVMLESKSGQPLADGVWEAGEERGSHGSARTNPGPITDEEISDVAEFLADYRGNLSEFWADS